MYKIDRLSVVLIIFLFLSTITLYVGSKENFILNDNLLLWLIVPITLISIIGYFVSNPFYPECDITKIILQLAVLFWFVLIIILVLLLLMLGFGWSFYNTLLIFPTLLFVFYFINIYLHNELLKLIQDNDSQINTFRMLQEGTDESGGGHFSEAGDY